MLDKVDVVSLQILSRKRFRPLAAASSSHGIPCGDNEMWCGSSGGGGGDVASGPFDCVANKAATTMGVNKGRPAQPSHRDSDCAAVHVAGRTAVIHGHIAQCRLAL